MRRKFLRGLCLCLVCLCALAACNSANTAAPIIVSLTVDGQELSYPQPIPITVGEFLQQANVTLGPLDEVTPPQFTQITDGMHVTVTRVQESQSCENQEMPFKENRIPNEGLNPGGA